MVTAENKCNPSYLAVHLGVNHVTNVYSKNVSVVVWFMYVLYKNYILDGSIINIVILDNLQQFSKNCIKEIPCCKKTPEIIFAGLHKIIIPF